MRGHVKGQIWEAAEGLQLSQRSVQQSELCSDSFLWNAQNPCRCILWINLKQDNLILVNPFGKRRLAKKTKRGGKKSRGCMYTVCMLLNTVVLLA